MDIVKKHVKLQYMLVKAANKLRDTKITKTQEISIMSQIGRRHGLLVNLKGKHFMYTEDGKRF